jgi:hypothetical protein
MTARTTTTIRLLPSLTILDTLNATCWLDWQNDGIYAKQGSQRLGNSPRLRCLASCRPLERHSPRELLRTLCLSRSGWTGLECSQRVEVCGDGEQYIYLHGSTCVSSSDDGKHACDCSDANQGKALTLLVGDSCQHATTDVCTLGEPSSRGRSFYFCMNVTVDQPHPGWAPTARSPGKEVIPRSDRSSV